MSEKFKENPKIETDLISLRKATKYCDYSGDYLKLRARQGKLKAVKIGRAWATKREWVEGYVREMEEYKENRWRQGEVKIDVKEREAKEVRPTRRISLFPEFELRPALTLALIFLLLFSSIALSKESLKTILQETLFYVQQTTKTIDYVLKESKKSLASSLDSLNQTFINVAQVIKTTDYEDFKEPIPLFKEYFKWLGNSLKTVFVQKPKALAKTILLVGSRTSDKLRKGFKTLVFKFQTKIKELKEFITRLFKPRIVEKEPEKPVLVEVTKEEFEKLKQEIETIKKEGLPVREVVKEIEVSRITKVEPIKEITKEIKTLDDESLKRIQTALFKQETDVEKLKLAARFGYVNVIFPDILPLTGDTSIIILGTITTGTWQGIPIADEYITNDLTLSSLGVSGSTTLGGSSSDTLTVNATSLFNGLLTANEQLLATKAPTEAHTGTWSVDSGTWQADDATIYINPSSATGDSNLLGLAVDGFVKFAIDAEGDIFGNNLILEGSTSTGATTIAGDLRVEGNTTLGDVSTDTLTFNASFLAIPNNLNIDSNTLFIDASGNMVGIGTTGPNQKLSVAGTLGILEGGTSPTYYTIFQGGDQAADITYTLPTTDGNSDQFLSTDGGGVLSWAQAGVNDATYLTLTYHDDLTAERVLTQGTNISITDGGANSTLTLATVANPSFTTSVTTPLLTTSAGDLTVDPAGNLVVKGSTSDNTTAALNVQNLAGTPLLYVRNDGNVGIGTDSPGVKLDVSGGSVRTTNQLISTVASSTAPLAVSSNTKVANLNADLLDGFDSSAFGDATAANQTTILNRIGLNTDAASMSSTLFAGQQAVYNRVDNAYSACYSMEAKKYCRSGYGCDCNVNAPACISGWTQIATWGSCRNYTGTTYYGRACCLPR